MPGYNGIEIRKAERVAICRGCDTKIERGKEMVSWYTIRGQSSHIHLCFDCVKKMYEMLIEKEV